jgi:beta-glucosidase
MAGMSNDAPRLGPVEWGCADATVLADGGRPADSERSQRWAGDLRAMLGGVPVTRRVVAGWQQLQPDGQSTWDPAALARCDRSIDAILDSGRLPVITLSHNDLPPWLEAGGGWLNRESAQRFADYAGWLGSRLGDRVTRWVTSTDFTAPSIADHVAGMTPPGRGIGAPGLVSVHHVLLGHGLAVQSLRGAGVDSEISGTAVLIGGYPATAAEADREALRRLESWTNRLFLDPLLLGRHMTVDGVCPVASTGCVRDGDMEIISAPQDTLHLSWHAPVRVTTPASLPRLLPAADCLRALSDLNRVLAPLDFALVPFEGVQTGPHGWPLVPEGLADALAGLAALYGDRLPPLRVVDNGMGEPAGRSAQRRRALLTNQLTWLRRIIDRGMPVRGYEYWPITDNLDWIRRYSQLYSITVPDHGRLTPPAIPCDWARSGPFQVEAPRRRSRLRLV